MFLTIGRRVAVPQVGQITTGSNREIAAQWAVGVWAPRAWAWWRRKQIGAWNQDQTLKDCLACHIYCTELVAICCIFPAQSLRRYQDLWYPRGQHFWTRHWYRQQTFFLQVCDTFSICIHKHIFILSSTSNRGRERIFVLLFPTRNR